MDFKERNQMIDAVWGAIGGVSIIMLVLFFMGVLK